MSYFTEGAAAVPEQRVLAVVTQKKHSFPPRKEKPSPPGRSHKPAYVCAHGLLSITTNHVNTRPGYYYFLQSWFYRWDQCLVRSRVPCWNDMNLVRSTQRPREGRRLAQGHAAGPVLVSQAESTRQQQSRGGLGGREDRSRPTLSESNLIMPAPGRGCSLRLQGPIRVGGGAWDSTFTYK